jgi:hypothetical protein
VVVTVGGGEREEDREDQRSEPRRRAPGCRHGCRRRAIEPTLPAPMARRNEGARL